MDDYVDCRLAVKCKGESYLIHNIRSILGTNCRGAECSANQRGVAIARPLKICHFPREPAGFIQQIFLTASSIKRSAPIRWWLNAFVIMAQKPRKIVLTVWLEQWQLGVIRFTVGFMDTEVSALVPHQKPVYYSLSGCEHHPAKQIEQVIRFTWSRWGCCMDSKADDEKCSLVWKLKTVKLLTVPRSNGQKPSQKTKWSPSKSRLKIDEPTNKGRLQSDRCGTCQKNYLI